MQLAQNLQQIHKDAGLSTLMYSIKPGQVLQLALPYLFGAAGIILIINIVTAGFKLMTSVGNPKSIESAQAKLSSSLIGILVLLISFWIVQILMTFLGIKTKIFI